jgi:Zn ribbon nucleic-acid-binding protein
MSLEILCPNCATDDHLSGTRRDQVIVITCAGCGLEWERPVAPHCATCGSTDVVAQPVPLLERSRGTQMSITAMHIETLCRTCDADRLAERGEGHLPRSLGD